ncbi:MAG: antibiotic biosynthesis monooxygenase [Saprospiraceae bacterium]|nr:antibiotic biosynthesis monooxygenase [Saprospiraceae bacterium]
MITRIVKLTFKPEHIDEFKEIWSQSKELIAGFEGCYFVEMLETLHEENICFTYSVWENEAALNNYRHSELFNKTWARTKILFDGKPEAWSTQSNGFEGVLKKEHHEKN